MTTKALKVHLYKKGGSRLNTPGPHFLGRKVVECGVYTSRHTRDEKEVTCERCRERAGLEELR